MEPPTGFERLERLPGHRPLLGKSAGQELNWAYRVRELSTGQECISMACKPNHSTLIDCSTWDLLQTDHWRNTTWYYAPNGYISRTVKKDDIHKYISLHQLILGHVGHGKGGKSIDHINQNKLDNRTANLRIVSQSLQNMNRGKVSRQSCAKPLPDCIQEPLPKFCIYYKECYNKEKNLWREFFTIEGHPAQNGLRKATTKSGKVSIQEKLLEAVSILANLDASSV